MVTLFQAVGFQSPEIVTPYNCNFHLYITVSVTSFFQVKLNVFLSSKINLSGIFKGTFVHVMVNYGVMQCFLFSFIIYPYSVEPA